jgi:hypothetical protein
MRSFTKQLQGFGDKRPELPTVTWINNDVQRAILKCMAKDICSQEHLRGFADCSLSGNWSMDSWIFVDISVLMNHVDSIQKRVAEVIARMEIGAIPKR